MPENNPQIFSDAVSSLEDDDFQLPIPSQAGGQVAVEDEVKKAHSLGFGFFDNDSTISANVWVLCINHDFDIGLQKPRTGNKKDVERLRETVTNRGCIFKDLSCKRKEEILHLFQSEENLLKYFKSQQDPPAEIKKPNVFILFLLSHGANEGIIYTEHPIQDGVEHESYKVSEIWDGLKIMPFTNDCIVLLMIGACRGSFCERLFKDDIANPVIPEKGILKTSKAACRLLNEPNKKNFVILYATVESTTSIRYKEIGTNLVFNFCDQLNNMQENQPLEVFLTNIKRKMHNFALTHDYVQTPELRIFPCPQFTIIGNGNNSQGFGYNPPESKFMWSSKSNGCLVRGRALFFGEESDLKHNFKTAFQNLEFQVEDCARNDVESTINSAASQSFQTDHCLVVVAMSEILCNFNPDYQFRLGLKANDGTIIPIENITNQFIGTNCRALVGKPKIFLFLDTSQRTYHPKIPKPTVMETKAGSNHSGIYIIMATSNEAIKDILEGLRSSSLRNDRCLQEVMADAIRKHTRVANIMPQITSTLHWLLYFPESSEADVDPALKQRSQKSTNKIVKLNNKFLCGSFRSLCLQSDSVTFVSASDNNFNSVTNRLAHTLVTAQPEFIIFRFQIDDHMDYIKSAEFNNASALSVLERLVELEIDLNFTELQTKIHQGRLLLIALSSICYDVQAAPCTNNLLKKLYTLKVPIIIGVNSYDLKCLKEVTSYSSKIVSYIEVEPQNRSTIIQQLKAKLKWSSAKCLALFEKLNYNKHRLVFSNSDFFSILLKLLEDGQNVEGNLFQMYELYINNYLKSETDANSKKFYVGIFSQAALIMYGDTASILLEPERIALERFSNLILISESGQIKFTEKSLADFLVAREILLLKSKAVWKHKFEWEEILTQHRFRAVRVFLNSFLEWENGPQSVFRSAEIVTQELSTYVENNDFLQVACEEGNYELFKVICNLTLYTSFPKEKLNQYLQTASRSHERLALTLLRHGADIWSVLEKYRNEGLLHCVAANGACDLMKIFLKELGKVKKSELRLEHIPGSSQDEEFPQAQPDHTINKFVRQVINSIENMGCATIHTAAENGRTEMVMLLLANGANPSLIDNWNNQWTPLHYAVLNGHTETTEALLKHLSSTKKKKFARLRLLGSDLRVGLDILLEKGSYSTSKSNDDWFNKNKISRRNYEDLLAFVVEYKAELVRDVLLGRNLGFMAVQRKRLDILNIVKTFEGENMCIPDLKRYTLLHIAAEVGNLQAIRWLRHKIPIDAKNTLKQTPLDIATSKTQVEAMKKLMKCGAVPTMQTIYYAANRVDRQSCEILLEAGAPLADPSGESVVHMVAKTGTIEALKLLVDLGADPSATDDEKNTPLHLVVTRIKRIEFVKYLLKLDVDVDAQTVEGMTPLHIACRHNAVQVAILLLDHGANPNLSDIHNFNALHHSAASYDCFHLLLSRNNVRVAAETECEETVIALAEKMESVLVLNALHKWLSRLPTSRNERELLSLVESAQKRLKKQGKKKPKRKGKIKIDENSIHDTVRNGKLDMVNTLLDQGISINAEDSEKQKPLHIAVAVANAGPSKVLKRLLEHAGVDVNAQDIRRNTPLHIAAKKSGVAVAKLLIEKGAIINAINKGGQQPLHIAIENDNETLVMILLEKRADVNAISHFGSPLHIAAKKSSLKIMKHLLTHQANRGALDLRQATPLHCAAAAGSIQKVKILLEKGGEKFLHAKDCDGNTPAHVAAKNNYHPITDYLILRGANPDEKNYYLETPTKIGKSQLCKRGWKAQETGLFDEFESAKKRLKLDQPGTSKM